LWGSMRPEFSPCLTATSIEPPKAPPQSVAGRAGVSRFGLT
jgi:hypothetical protein